MASKMAMAYGKAEQYGLSTVQAQYMQTHFNGAPASMLDMAEMFAKKYQKDGHMK